MDDPLKQIRGILANQAGHETELRASLSHLEREINDALDAADVHVSSDHTVLDRYRDDESIYGFLSFDHGQLSIAYRSSEDDFMEHVHQETLDHSYSLKPLNNYRLKPVDSCSD